ncbi:MAG: class I SAM-dependent methyltransferase [Bdellovibrionales bacterium]|nr:class I SAM-dependent methyltransferase [Bdellovibrionales bacterium]
MKDLQFALEYRKSIHADHNTEALRIFYGPGESRHPELSEIAIDRFRDHFWITQWKKVSSAALSAVAEFLKTEFGSEFKAAVLMDRSEVASDAEATPLLGTPFAGRFEVREWGVTYLVQMSATKHPGLFLDHAPLRKWLIGTQSTKAVLNLFSYTGSLSVAAAKGGAAQVTTIDLSKSTIEWAKENWKHAGLPDSSGDFIYGDVFEWLPKLQKRGAQFDTILCDPPSFSRSKNGTFSTQKDTARLHEAILPLLKTGGILITSINSENLSERQFLKDIEDAASRTLCGLRVISRIDLPPTFPTQGELSMRYLKGFFLIKTDP